MNFKVTAEDALKQLMEQNEFPFTVIMKHGSMTIEYFAPKEVDTQTQHKQDEIYIVITGHSTFYRNGERISCKKNDVLFVPAGTPHTANIGSDNGAELATYVVEKGKPLVTLVK